MQHVPARSASSQCLHIAPHGSALVHMCTERVWPKAVRRRDAEIQRPRGLSMGRDLRRGMVPTMLGILPYAGLDIAAFELMHDRLQLAYGDPAAVPPAALLVAGMLSSTGAQLVAYPLGFVRTRLQVRACSPALLLSRQSAPLLPCFCAPALAASARPCKSPL